MDLLQFYNENESFKRYVDRECIKNGKPIEVTLTHKLVQITAEYYLEVEQEKAMKVEEPEIEVEKIDCGCGGAC